MLNLATIRKENAAKNADLTKAKKEHEKRIKDHEKRLSDLKEILSKSQQKAADLQEQIEAVVIEGGDVEDLKSKVHNEQLNVQTYTGAITALEKAIQRESELLSEIDKGLSATDQEEIKCKLIETARAYNKQAADFAKTLSRMDELIHALGGAEKIGSVYCGNGLINNALHALSRIPVVFIKGSEGEEIPEDQRGPGSERHWYYWDLNKDSVYAKIRNGQTV